MATRLICTECGTGHLTYSRGVLTGTGEEDTYVRCTDCGQVLNLSLDIEPYAEGRKLVWDGPFLAAVESGE